MRNRNHYQDKEVVMVSLTKLSSIKNTTNLMYENIPINQRPSHIEHLRKVEECEEFLIREMGFIKTLNEWCSYEFNTVFKKENTEVRIVFETSVPSSIILGNTALPYDESKGLTNVEFISAFHKNSFEIIKGRLKEKKALKYF